MIQLKPALSYDEQIEHLKQAHNLLIADENNAREILKEVSYYRLSAYGIGLTKEDDREKYIDGVSLEHIYRLYQFDSIFRNKLIHVIEELEIQLRTQLAYLLALKYGPEGYMDPTFFQDKRRKDGVLIHSIVIESFKKECGHQKTAPLVKHHMEKYGGHFPIWVATELFTFGNLSSLYSIMSKQDQKEIARLYDTEPKYLGGWILALVEIRNICAHYSRLYNMPLKQRPFLYSENSGFKSNKLNKIFPALITIKRMLKDDERWETFEKQLEELMDEYKDVVVLSFIGFPEEWKNILSANKKETNSNIENKNKECGCDSQNTKNDYTQEVTSLEEPRAQETYEPINMDIEHISLANSRTLLAYIRTSIIAFTLGIGMFEFINNPIINTAGVALMAIAFAILVVGLVHWYLEKRKLEKLGRDRNSQ